MKQAELVHGVYKPLDMSRPLIVSRLGYKPSHINCGCPGSWASVIEPLAEGQDSLFAIDVEPQDLNAEERDTITHQVKRIDGSGGLAPYEDFGIVEKRGDLARSIAAVCLQTGVIVFPNGDLQQPLFVLSDPMPPLRWDIDSLPNLTT